MTDDAESIISEYRIILSDGRKPGGLKTISSYLAPLIRREEYAALLRADLNNSYSSRQEPNLGLNESEHAIEDILNVITEMFEFDNNLRLRDARGIILGVIIGAVFWMAISLIIFDVLFR